MARNPLHDDVQFVRDSRLPDIELRTCSYATEAFRPHTHEGYSIALVEEGATRFDVHGQSEPAVAGDIVIIPPHQAHACNPEPHISYRLFYIEVGWLSGSVPLASGDSEQRALRQVVRDAVLFEDLWQLHEEISAGDVDNKTRVRLQECLRRLIDECLEGSVTAGETPEPTIDAAREILARRWREPVSLDELADAVGASRYQLIRGFKRVTGLTPHAYQLQLRVEAAKQALARGDSITEVALECGFADQSHFTRVFRGHTGATPSQYRNA